MLLAFYKPYGVLSQFSSDGSPNRTLAEFGFPPDVYAIGRLDADSEGLLLLSDERSLVDKLLHPRRQHPREYWAQVEGDIQTSSETSNKTHSRTNNKTNSETNSNAALERLRRGGIAIQDYHTRPCGARALSAEELDSMRLPERVPPIRFRKAVPTSWLALELTEGKNRQVRRMTAAVGLPTLRLVRVRIGRFSLASLIDSTIPAWRELNAHERALVLSV
jgi:23S rRNA pseudouridine2457 synthase